MNSLAAQKPLSVQVLVLPESSMMCVASVLEPMRAANRVSGKTLYHWTLTSLTGEAVNMTCAVPLIVNAGFDGNSRGDFLVIIAGFNQHRHVSSYNLARIRNAASGFGRVAGVEAGTWILARAGLLNGRQATTHWEDFEAFANANPEIDVRLDRHITDGKYVTCGGAAPAFDMMLGLIRDQHGPAIAMEVASVFIHDDAHVQSEGQPLIALGKVASREPRLRKAVRCMEEAVEQPLPIGLIAERIGVSTNTLEAMFKRHTGMTPGKFYLNLRLKAANRLILDSSLSFQEIAVRSGFNSLSAFSRAYSREFGRSASKARQAT